MGIVIRIIYRALNEKITFLIQPVRLVISVPQATSTSITRNRFIFTCLLTSSVYVIGQPGTMGRWKMEVNLNVS